MLAVHTCWQPISYWLQHNGLFGFNPVTWDDGHQAAAMDGCTIGVTGRVFVLRLPLHEG